MIWKRLVSVLLPALLLVLLTQAPATASEQIQPIDSSLVQGPDRDAHPADHGDFTTRKNRHAASIEEYFAIDDDSDQYAASPAQLDWEFPSYIVLADRSASLPVLALPRSHRACAAGRQFADPGTGPRRPSGRAWRLHDPEVSARREHRGIFRDR